MSYKLLSSSKLVDLVNKHNVKNENMNKLDAFNVYAPNDMQGEAVILHACISPNVEASIDLVNALFGGKFACNFVLKYEQIGVTQQNVNC